MTIKKRRVILLLCALSFLATTPFLLLYTTGYRWNYKIGVYKTGGLYVASPLTGSEIFVNNKKRKETSLFQGGLFLQNLKPGKYSLLVTKQDYWPWTKTLTVEEQLVVEARAILIPQNPKGVVITRGENPIFEKEEYETIWKTMKSISQKTPAPILNNEGYRLERPTDENEKVVKEDYYTKITYDERQKLWWNPQENKLWAEWLGKEKSLPYFFCDDDSCRRDILILDSAFPIRSADFYPKRRDVIVVAINNGVYAIEIDGRGGRIIQPIYKGKSPISIINKKKSSVFIFEPEDSTLIEITLK